MRTPAVAPIRARRATHATVTWERALGARRGSWYLHRETIGPRATRVKLGNDIIKQDRGQGTTAIHVAGARRGPHLQDQRMVIAPADAEDLTMEVWMLFDVVL